MSGTCHILCAGPGGGANDLSNCHTPGDFLIAVDGGFAHCLTAGLEPDLFVGDLDSLAPELVGLIGCERIELPCEKDDTDTIYACKEGLARGYTNFALHAALGGRGLPARASRHVIR